MTTPSQAAPRDTTDAALAELRAVARPSLVDLLGIEIVELTPERVILTMPVDERTRQPFGILHGGASVALVESAVSLGAWRNVDRERYAAVGLEINANHLRAKRDGTVRCTATPVHRGRSTQVWTATITDEEDRAVCVARCTLAIVPVAQPGR